MRSPVVLALVIAIGLALRGVGVLQGYPDFYGHVDEVGVAASIWNFFREATLRPTEYTYPAFYSYLVAAALALGSAWLTPSLPGAGWLDRLVFLSYSDPAMSALVGRSLSIIADLTTVLLVYRLTRQVGLRRWSLLAALAWSVAVVPTRQAHMALPDSVATLLATGVICLSWRILAGTGAWRDYLAAGFVCGLVLATKYNGVLVALTVVAAHLQRPQPPRPRAWGARLLDPRLWGAGATALVAAVLASPYLALAPDQYFDLARYQVSSLGFTLRENSPWWWIGREFVQREYLLGGVILAGVVRAIWRRDRFDLLLLAAVVPAFLYIGSWTRESLHYLLPYMGALIVQAVRVVAEGAGRLRRRWPAVAAPWIWAAFLVPNVVVSAQQAIDLRRPDTRALAAQWIRRHLPPGARIAMTWFPYCPRLQPLDARRAIASVYVDRPEWLRQLRRTWAEDPAYRIVNLEIWLKEPVLPPSLAGQVDLEDPETRRIFSRGWRSPRQLQRAGVEYLILPEAVYVRYLHEGATPADAAARYRLLVNRAYFQHLLDPKVTDPVAVFTPGARARGGTIRILRLRPSGEG